MGTSMLGEINALRQMSVAELRARWIELYGEETRSRNREYLWRRLAWRIQEHAHGGLSNGAKQRISDLAPLELTQRRGATVPGPTAAPTVRRDPRLPAVGSTLTRRYQGEEVRVAVLDAGFEWDGRRFDSLSAVAHAVTGQKWNGRLFFGITKRKRGR